MSDLNAIIAKVDTADQQDLLTADSAANIKRWLSKECYAKWHSRIVELVNAADYEFLNKHFWEAIPFGTGGRRGPMGELGSATINERTIAESAHGMAAYLASVNGGTGGRAVVACDTRNNSELFARITASTFAAHGLQVFIFDKYRSTPALSFAVRHLNCDIGVMISASHNPPADNGFKAYWNTGAQVLPPHDKGIIEQVDLAEDIPHVDFDQAVSAGQIEIIGEKVDAAYIASVTQLALSDKRDVRAVFSPLHGVGETNVFASLKALGFDGLTIHEPHRQPDGNFPNVADHFPNPERTVVFDSIVESAQKSDEQIDLILASDPDADRIALSIRKSDGTYQALPGNPTGALITDYVLNRMQENGTLTGDHYVVETLVTTPMTATIAESYGAKAITDLLVGFKYIAKAIDEAGPENFVFATEESIGYLAGQYCRDKDAAAGAIYCMELAAELKAQGKTLLDRLDELYVQHGYHVESQESKYCHGPEGRAQINSIMEQLRTAPPASLAGINFEQVRDYGQLEIRSLPANSKSQSIEQPNGNLLFFDSEAGPFTLSVAARPSGTEPKIKFYFFARATGATTETLAGVRSEADAKLKQATADLMAWIDSVLA